MEVQQFTKDKTATNESLKSLGSIIIKEDTCSFTRDSMFTCPRKNSNVSGKHIACYYAAVSPTEGAQIHAFVHLVISLHKN